MNNKKYISDLRSKCKDKSDHAFVDAMESIITEYEKPRKEPEYFIPIGNFTEDWDKALKDYINKPHQQGSEGILAQVQKNGTMIPY